MPPSIDPYEELENISWDLEGYMILKSLGESAVEPIAFAAVTAIKDFPSDERDRLLRKFSAEARRWAAENPAFREEIESAIQLIHTWLANPATYDSYHEEVVEPVRRAMALDCFDFDD